MTSGGAKPSAACRTRGSQHRARAEGLANRAKRTRRASPPAVAPGPGERSEPDLTFCSVPFLSPSLRSQPGERQWELDRVSVLFVFKGATSYHTAQEIWLVAHFK